MNHWMRRLILCILSIALAAFFIVLSGCPRANRVTVPKLVGMTEPQAITALALVDLELGIASNVYSTTVAAGLVVSQTPAPGDRVTAGTQIDIVISLGPSPAEGEGESEGEGEGEGETLTVLVQGDVPLDFVQIPAGSFTMGSPSSELGRMADEGPQHLVTIADPFWLTQTEVTKQQWQALMGTTPWEGQANVLTHADSPAVYVSWNDAHSFIAALNSLTGQTYRLPSEAQWEYAARAGSMTRFYWGKDPTFAAITSYAWWDGNADAIDQDHAHVTGLKLPNNRDLYDVAGNVWEWCQDWYHIAYHDAPNDGSPWEVPAGTMRIRRGGSWTSPGELCRSAYRSLADPTTANDVIGFRVAK
ncbi:MAG: SUMF1/EgtB/PvdO family nonheme iron enzyme [Candidatus Hydrogenedentes bacterium]|nr:SUMF1/EgtB/PvdO family nonheme iron enzyme [Candidatus Hydrogenedentota bacterium]